MIENIYAKLYSSLNIKKWDIGRSDDFGKVV